MEMTNRHQSSWDGSLEAGKASLDKGVVERIENVSTNERVPGHANYYEKNGLRTYGDNEDHDHEPPAS